MLRIEVLDHHHRETRSRRQGRKQMGQGPQAAGRSSHADDGEWIFGRL
jgi:hypothetical protein